MFADDELDAERVGSQTLLSRAGPHLPPGRLDRRGLLSGSAKVAATGPAERQSETVPAAAVRAPGGSGWKRPAGPIME